MVNKLNEKQSYGIVIAAIISSLVVMMSGLITGMVYAVRAHREPIDAGRDMAQYLMVDAAYELKRNMSALRLCNDAEPAETLNKTALVHAVRAETALECHMDDWADSRSKEAFLNDVATILHSYSPLETIELADMLYAYSGKFYDSVSGGTVFEYNGELMSDNGVIDPDIEITQDDIDRAAALVESALGTSRVEYVGAWGGNIEFYTERNGNTGYALVCNGKIKEYSFMRDDDGQKTDVEQAEKLALQAAAACGYDDLAVRWSEDLGRSVGVIMCRSYNGALATDDYASAVVVGDETVSFTAGGCDCEHKDIPSPKVTEEQAKRSADGGGDGTLVVRKINGVERICYEYRYDLDDGVHFVYVCAENGKQIEVK